MDTSRNFTLFSALSPELRIQIWNEALSVRAVLTTLLVSNATIGNDDNNLPKLIPLLAYVGSAPFMIGLACMESRKLLEKMYPNPLRLSRGPGASDAVYWVDWESTVVHLRAAVCTKLFGRILGTTEPLNDFFKAFPKEELPKFRHVVVEESMHVWHRGHFLLRHFHGLRTVIIQSKPADVPLITGPHAPLNEEMAAHFLDILEYPVNGHASDCKCRVASAKRLTYDRDRPRSPEMVYYTLPTCLNYPRESRRELGGKYFDLLWMQGRVGM